MNLSLLYSIPAQEPAMPFDSVLPQSSADPAAAMRHQVRAALAGWKPRGSERPSGFRPVAALRAALALLRRPLSDKGLGLCY
jgi:hypothetical protein